MPVGLRIVNVLAPGEYIRRMEGFTPAAGQVTPIDRQTEIGETMMMGLRLTQEGVSNRAFASRFGQTLTEVFPREIAELIGLGLLEWAGANGDVLRLTQGGRLLGNQVFMRFI